MKRMHILLTLIALIAVGMACSTLSGSSANNPSQNNGGNAEDSFTATPTLGDSSEESPTEATSSDELPPLTFETLLTTGIETGQWTEGEGLVLFLQYFVGEAPEDTISQALNVAERSGTGIVRMAGDYLNNTESDPTQVQEIERLLRMLFPPQEVLDNLSSPTSLNASHKLAASSLPAPAQSEAACMDFAGTGYEGNIDLGVTCYLYVEQELDGNRFRVYYPEWWQGDEEKENQIGLSLDALADSATTYGQFSALTIKNVNMVFAILPSGNTNGEQYYFDTDTQACPLTMYPMAFANNNVEKYQQVIAHEMFHCVQDWSFPNTSPYSDHSWWLEGTADYYSNLVYPTANLEWEYLYWFDRDSRNTPIFNMTYENFAFFQFMGNTYSPGTLIDILMQVSSAGSPSGQQATLSAVDSMDLNFNRFVVQYLSTGIPDSGGGSIFSSPTTLTGTKTIEEEGDVPFTVQPFVAMRYSVTYKEQKRFLQNPTNNDGTQFSSVEAQYRTNIDLWSDLPPEIRSECEKDVVYLFAITTTKDGYTNYDVDVTLAEKAECDPCLLGTWDIDKESYKAFMERIMAEADTQGMEIDMTFGGHQYLQFETDGKVLTQRDEFSITINNQITTIINGHGQGNYSTTDGERLTVSGFVDFTEDATMTMGGGQIAYTSETATFSFFGTDYSDPNLNINLNDDAGPQNHSIEYVCENDTLSMIIQGYEKYGDVVFNRVEKILPTPVPTAAPPSNPEP